MLNLGSVAIPLAFSFEKKVSFYKHWQPLFIGMSVMAFLFLVWDVWFTHLGVWEFNPKYVLGPHIFNMPVEEYMFFFCIPYACLFTHEALKYYIPYTVIDNHGKLIGLPVAIILIITGIVKYDHIYTAITFLSLGWFLIYLIIKKSASLGRFFFTYLITLIPFLLVNGYLTSMPVLIYNDAENLGIRIGTIPLDDFFYWMLLLLGNVVLFEKFKIKVIKKED